MDSAASKPWDDTEDVQLAREFLLPSVEEVQGILRPDWVRPKSLEAKEAIVRLLGWEGEHPFGR